MNLENLKPAWRQNVLFNSMDTIDQNELLSIIEKAEYSASRKITRQLATMFMFLILTVCCQAG